MMTNLEAIDIAEGLQDATSEQEYYAAWQQLINTGLAWSLQGWFGRTAMYLIQEGHCKHPSEDA
jgi:hypothetical protein